MSRTPKSELNILLLEENAAYASLVAEYLQLSRLPHHLTTAHRLSVGLEIVNRECYDLTLLDLSLSGTKAVEILEVVKMFSEEGVVIVLTDTSDDSLCQKILQAGAQDCLPKNTLSSSLLYRSIRYAMERATLVKKVEASTAEIQNNERSLRHLFESSNDAMLILSPDYKIRLLNPAATNLLDADTRTLIGETFPFALESGKATELEIPASDNRIYNIELRSEALLWEGTQALLATMHDVTSARVIERAFHREKESLSIILETISDAVIVIDEEGNIERINEKATGITGIKKEHAIGKQLADVLRFQDPTTGENISCLDKFLLSNRSHDGSPGFGIPLIRDDGKHLLVSAEMHNFLENGSVPCGAFIILQDISQKKLAEEERLKSEKLHSIGLLAGGIAHDFNNILSAILGNISVIRLDSPENHKHAEKLIAVEKAALQATSLTQQLLTLSKGGAPVMEFTTVDQLIEDCAAFMLRGSNVSYEFESPKEALTVEADTGQIAQVVNNLLINADQAMPDGGTVKIKLDTCKLSNDEVRGLKAGQYIRIAVQDEGAGMSPKNLKHIFDPYFTTKIDGNGLGLASSYSIIKSHQGMITVKSEINKGSCFKVYIPRTRGGSIGPFEVPEKKYKDTESKIQSGEGKILIMDDMEAMMMVAGEIISVLGYQVEYSTNGEEAIEAYKKAKESGNPFDAVVFDLTVPGGMGGEQAAEILMNYDPELIAIASSGYTDTNVMSDYKNSPFSAVVPKPYRIKEMSAALHQVLNH